MACADGITISACTPHILPGVYNNNGHAIKAAVASLQKTLDSAAIPLQLVAGADVHLAPDLVLGLKDGRIISLNDSRYFLLEPPHHVAPPRLEDYIFQLRTAGYTAIVTHPERLSWIEVHFPVIQRLVHSGAWMQITAGSLTGRFGRRPRYWAERLLEEGLCHILATDAHDVTARAPRLAEGRDAASRRVSDAEVINLVEARPRAVIDNVNCAEAPLPARGIEGEAAGTRRKGWAGLFTWRGRARNDQ